MERTPPPQSGCGDDQRLRELRRYEILDTPPEQAFDDITRLIAHVCQTPIAVINFVDERRQWFKSEIGLGVRETPLDVSICAHALLQRDLFVVRDTAEDDRFRHNPLVVGEPRLRFYAGALLETPEGSPLGTLCVLDRRPRDLSDAQLDALRMLARQVMSQLELRRALAAQVRTGEEQRRTGERLRGSEARLAAVVHTSLDCIVGMDHEGRVTEWNPAAERTFGYGRDEALGRELAELIIPPALRPRHRTGLAHYLATGEGPILGTRLELTAVRKDGAELPVELTITPLDLGGEPAFTGYLRDITAQSRAADALRQSEQRLRAVVEATPECVKIVSPAGGLSYMNSAGLGMIEADSLPAVQDACVFDVVAPEHRAEWQARHARVCGGERLTWEFEVVGLRGTRRWMETHAVPLPMPDGSTAQLAVTRDVSERKRAERERERLLELERDARAEAETFVRVGRALSAELDLHRLVQVATDAATELTGAAFGAFFYNVPDADGGHYTLYTISGVAPEAFAKFPMPRATDVFGPTFRGEGVVRLDDVTADARYGRNAPYHGMPEGHLPVRSYLAVPVRSRSGQVLGGLFLGHPEAARFTERHERLVGGVAAHAAVAVDNARLYEAARASREAVERSLGQLRAVVGSMAEGLVLSDPQGNLLEWNPAALEMHGHASAEEVHRHLDNFPAILALSTPGGRVVPFEDWPMHRVLRGESFHGYEVDVRRLDIDFGRVISYSGSPVRDRDGKVLLAVLTLHDVTEERRAQAALAESAAQFRQLAETIPQLAWMAKPDGFIFWYNRRWYEYTGTTPQQMEGWGWQSVHDPAELPRVVDRWQHSIRTGDAFEMEFPLRGADGQFRWFLTRVEPLRDGGGNIALWFGTNTDIEDRRRVAEERAQSLDAERAARREAERTGRLKDEFLATLSHELRTPLNAILGWSQVLRHGGSRDEQDLTEGLDTIERNARAQAKIIEDLLEMSRIISGKIRLDVQRLDLAAVVQAAAETVGHAADAKGVRLSVVLDPLAGPVGGDPARLQQVFWNLLSNSIKFTPKGGRVQVLLERVNSHLEVSVVDSGEGISPQFLPHVFDRFKQADASTTRRHGGLGLGLSIVKQLVELHGGTVRAKSPGEGGGSTFTVALPLTPIHDEPGPPHERRHPDAGPDLTRGLPDDCPRLKGLRVLVVDDEADSRALVKRLLGDCEAEVFTAGSAAEALLVLRRERPDVLVSDIGMPGEDGYSLIRKVRALGPEDGGDVPAVALTAYARSEDRRRAVLAGYNHHVAKPVEAAELVTMVASLAKSPPKT